MKKIIAYFSCIVVCGMLSFSANAQTPSTQVDPNEPVKLTDPTVSKRLATDWNTRNSKMKDVPVEWYNSNDGYYGRYSNESMDYMTRYDKKGNYVETMRKKDWNDGVPSDLKSSFENSNYKTHKVSSYWEVSDPNRKGYYMELTDDQGKNSKVWVDEKNNFSTSPYVVKPKN